MHLAYDCVMANLKNSKLMYDDKEQKDNKKTTTVVIITSVDGEDDDKILSCLKPSSVETFVVDLNHAYQINNKRSLPQSEQNSPIDVSKNINSKKRKADLTCVVCGGQAIGYNFTQISCESCKAFFRRNAFEPIEKTKCVQHKDNLYEIRCDIRHDVKHKCRRCRLMKCFQEGMLKNHILTPEEKQSKKQRLEENRQLRSTLINNNSSTMNSNSKSVGVHTGSSLSESDWSCLSHIQNAYFIASQSTPSASSVFSLELAPDTMSAFMTTIDLQNFTAVKLINFLREIPEFDQLDEHDRVILVKYNLTLLFVLRHSLTYDSAREICYDRDSTTDVVSPSEEAFAQHCKSLFILCYGYEFHRIVTSILHVLITIIDKDPIITQLMMIIMIFSKGLSANDDQEPILNNEKSVFNAQSKYIDLLFRYLMEQSSFAVVTMKITRITEQLLKIQKVSRDFHQYVKSRVDLTNINPLMKSLLHLT